MTEMFNEDQLVQAQYGNFDLGQFRYDAAALCKYLIRAREQAEPGFLEDDDAYQRWGLANIDDDREEPLFLLRKVRVLVQVIDAHMVSMGGSGGIALDDPHGEFKAEVAGFTWETLLDEAIADLEADENVDWKTLAEWDCLPSIRDALDSLPGPAEDTGWNVPGEPVGRSKRVQLFGFNDDPQAIVDQRRKVGLTKAQYDVVLTLLNSGRNGLSLNALAAQSGHGDARGIVNRLREYDGWKDVIHTAGKPGGRYYIF